MAALKNFTGVESLAQAVNLGQMRANCDLTAARSVSRRRTRCASRRTSLLSTEWAVTPESVCMVSLTPPLGPHSREP